MNGTTRPQPAWEPEPLPLAIPSPRRTHRPDRPEVDDERSGDGEDRPGSHVVVIDIG